MTGAFDDPGLDRALRRAAAEEDRAIASSGALARLRAAVMAGIAARSARRIPWYAVAAALILAAGLGSVAELTLVSGADDPGAVVLLDPMVFGPTEADLP